MILMLRSSSSNETIKMGDLKTWKLISEIRYPAAARLFDHRGEIAARWQQGDLSEWAISRNSVSIYDTELKTTLNASHQKAGVIQELPTNFSSYSTLSTNFYSHLIGKLKIKRIERIGLRILQVAERKDFSGLLRNMAGQLYALNNEHWAPLGGLPEDIGMPLTLRLGENRANFKIGPMERKQLAEQLTSDVAKEELPPAFVFIDFDLFKEEPQFHSKQLKTNILTFLEKGESEIIRASSEFLKLFGGFEE